MLNKECKDRRLSSHLKALMSRADNTARIAEGTLIHITGLTPVARLTRRRRDDSNKGAQRGSQTPLRKGKEERNLWRQSNQERALKESIQSKGNLSFKLC